MTMKRECQKCNSSDHMTKVFHDVLWTRHRVCFACESRDDGSLVVQDSDDLIYFESNTQDLDEINIDTDDKSA